MRMFKPLFLALVCLCSTLGLAQSLPLGQPLVTTANGPSGVSIQGAVTITLTSTACNTLTATGCTVGPNGPNVVNHNLVGSPGGAFTVTDAIKQGNTICYTNNTGQAATVGGGSGTTVAIPDQTGIGSTPAICVLSRDGTNYVQVGGSGGATPVGANAVQGSNSGATAFAATNPTTVLNGIPTLEFTDLPRAPLAGWFACLHNSGNQVCRVMFAGDSFTVCTLQAGDCTQGPALAADRIGDRFRQFLINAGYPSHGTGRLPIINQFTSTAPTQVSPLYYSISGTYDTNTNTLGPYQTVLNGTSCSANCNTLVHLANGAVVTFTASSPYDTANIYYGTTSSSGSLAIAIDGTGVGTASASSYTKAGTVVAGMTARLLTTSSVALGTHTLTMTSTGDNYVYAAEGTIGSVGISVDLDSFGSANSFVYATNVASNNAFSDLEPANLTIANIEINDIGNATNTTTYIANINALFAHQQALGSDIIEGIPPVNSAGATVYAPYTNAQLANIQSNPSTIRGANIQDRWGTPAANATAYLNLYFAGYSGSQVHPGTTGTRDWGEYLYNVSVEPSLAAISSGGVSSITPGSNVTCTPNTSGTCTGAVTINASGSGGTGANTTGLIENWQSQEGRGVVLVDSGYDFTNAMTASNVTWASATGFTGNVVIYNGTNSYASSASATNTSFDGSLPFSGCAWFNASTITPGAQWIFGNLNSTATAEPGWGLWLANLGTPGTLATYISSNIPGGNLIAAITTTAVVSAGSTYLACLTYDGSKSGSGVNIYVNGVAKTLNVVTNALTGSIASASPFYVGAAGGTAGPDTGTYFNGAIGRVRVYNRLLSAAEVSAMYSAGSGAF